MLPLVALLLLVRVTAAWDQTLLSLAPEPWVPIFPKQIAISNSSAAAPDEQAVISMCSPEGQSSLSLSEVRLRPGTASRCSWTLRAPDGLPICRLRVAVLSLHLPCGVGSLHVGSEVLCGGLLGARTLELPPDTRHVTAVFSSQGSSEKDFDVVVGLEQCVPEQREIVSDHDCGGLFNTLANTPVGLLSPGYPSHYPDSRNCLYVLQHHQSDSGPSACYLDIEFVDFTLESSSGCIKDRLEVEGVEGATFCGSRGGTTRIVLKDRKEARLRFISDGEGSAGGFRVLATLSQCEAADDPRQETVLVTETPQGESPSASLVPAPLPPPGRWPQCCGRVHIGPQFFITSPGFPAGVGGSGCEFHIARLAPTTCRLRLVLHLFLLFGTCDKHFLEVDGRRICGCQSRTQVLSFYRSPGEAVKFLRYFRTPFTPGGFIIEVLQEDCPGPGFRPGPGFHLSSTALEDSPNVFASLTSPWNITSSIKRSDTPNSVSVTHLDSFSLDPLVSDALGSARILHDDAHVHFPDSEIAGTTQATENVLPAGDTDTNAALGSGVCGAPHFKSWMVSAAGWASTVPSTLVQCPLGIFPPAKCAEFRAPSGWFTSPRYPERYPNNARVCYRIFRYAGQCGVQVSILDFDLEPSPTCSKDYMSLGGSSRYCGASLASTLMNLSFMSGDYTDILFVSDSFVPGRGFRAFYRQMACSAAPGLVPGALFPGLGPGSNNLPPGLPPLPVPGPVPFPYPAQFPVATPGAPHPLPIPRPVPVSTGPYQPSGVPERPSTPSPPTTRSPYPVPAPSPRTCGGEIRQQHFALSARDVAGHQECVFIVRRLNEDICGLQILPERIDLDCELEVVVANGRSFCSQDMQGQTVTLDFYGDAIEVLYRGGGGTQGDFLLHMQQVADCLDLDVTPVARVGKALPTLPPPACVIELGDPEGNLQAPALEPRAPHDLSCSYVFLQRPEQCLLQLDFHDFALAAGPICTESYLALRNHKYCGQDLRHTSHVIAFTAPTFEVPYHLRRDIPFARWNVSYSQRSCRPEALPGNTVMKWSRVRPWR